jgi:hypothetical protein
MFKLTVKGYYGRPVSYCLHLLKFNTAFESSHGGFTATADFMGFSYAFFTDIPVKYLFAVGNTEEGKRLLKERNSVSLTEQLSKYGQLTRFVETNKINSSNYSDSILLREVIADINSTYKEFGT